MLCSKCEKVLDLDISFPLVSNDESDDESVKLPHHEHYPALCRAANAGCELCQHIMQKHRGGIDESGLEPQPDQRMRITVEVFSDSFMFYIPIRIEYDDSGEDYSLGEDSVKVYVSTDERMF